MRHNETAMSEWGFSTFFCLLFLPFLQTLQSSCIKSVESSTQCGILAAGFLLLSYFSLKFKQTEPSFDRILTIQNNIKMKGGKSFEPQQRGENLTLFLSLV